MKPIIVTAFALGFTIPGLIAAPFVPASAAVIMYVALACVGFMLGMLTGWALEQPDVSNGTATKQRQIPAGRLGGLGLNPET